MVSSFVVDAGLRAVPIARLLDVRTELRTHGTVAGAAAGRPGREERPVLEGSQTLGVGTLYPSSNQPSRRYYLPQYRIATDDAGKPRVSLRYQKSDSEVGRLTIGLTWSPLTDPSATCVVMDHVTELALRTRIPIEGETGGVESTIALQPAQMVGPQLAESTTIFTDENLFASVYLAMREAVRGTALHLTIGADVAVRTWKQRPLVRPTLAVQAAAFQMRGALFTRAAMKPQAETAETANLAAVVKKQLLAKPQGATLTASPTVLKATMKLAQPAVTLSPAAATVATPALHAVATAPHAATLLQPHLAAGLHPIKPMPRPPRPMPVPEPPEPPAPPPPIAVPTPMSVVKPAMPTLAQVASVHAISIKEALQKSDFQAAGIKAIPTLVALDAKGTPALVDARLDCELSLPFTFDAAAPQNDAVYLDAGFQGVGIHLLRRMALDGNHAAFRDTLMPGVVLLPPSEFRIAREDAPPYLPTVTFLPSDFDTVDTTGAGGAEATKTLFRMAVVYRLVPWIDPRLDDLVRAELAHENITPQLLAVVPRSASLQLEFEPLAAEQQRTEATVDPAVGVSDSFDLDEGAFLRLWREHLAPPSGMLRGTVEYQLFDGSTARIPARVSLREPSPHAFQVDFAGASDLAAGRYRIAIRNRIESPTIIAELPGVELGDGAVAHAVDPQNHTGQTLQPNETRIIEYAVVPPTTALTELVPVVVGAPVPDVNRLFQLLTVATGFGSQSFTVKVRAAPGLFGVAPAAGLPLVGLLVEFDDGTRVTLTPEQPEQDVAVMGRFLDRLQGNADTQDRYFFRVTNLHADGEGARTAWSERRGTAVLEVGTASGAMDGW